jgi:hypothetical protein
VTAGMLRSANSFQYDSLISFRRRQRRLFVQVINEKQNARFQGLIEKARNRLLDDLIQTPDDWLKHINL